MNWISVKDRLPEIGYEVIVHVPSARTPVTALCRLIKHEGANEYHWDNSYGGNNWHASQLVTHWMPLPEPPKDLCGEKWLNGEYDK